MVDMIRLKEKQHLDQGNQESAKKYTKKMDKFIDYMIARKEYKDKVKEGSATDIDRKQFKKTQEQMVNERKDISELRYG